MIYFTLFLEFFKVGLFTFGGGYAMLPLIEQVVLKYQWLEEKQIINFMAVSESTPGPFAVNISTYIGNKVGGILGSFCATLGVILPSFLIILIISKFYLKFKNNLYVKGCMEGLRPIVVGLIGTAVISVTGKVFDFGKIASKLNLETMFIFVIAGGMAYKKVHPIVIILTSALLGIVIPCII